MSTLIKRAYEAALKELGIKEVEGPEDNPRVVKYLEAVFDDNDEKGIHDETPWCSAFVNWCVQSVGGKGSRSAAARSWLQWGKEPLKPQVGDIVIFRRGKSKWQGHVGFLAEDFDAFPFFVKVLGGNQSNSVCFAMYRKSLILGFRTSKDS